MAARETQPAITRGTSIAEASGDLRVCDIAYRFPHFELFTTTFSARAGEVVAIIGPNGSGKSTVLEIVSGHLKPFSGCVWLDREDLHHLNPRARAALVGLARQETILLFSFEVREFIRQGRHPHLRHGLFESGEDERWVEWAMEKTNLTSFAGRRVLELSSGEFQRAVLARTLAQRPRLLLLDEPTANLDPYNVSLIENIARKLNRQYHTTLVLVTHNVFQAHRLADRVVFLLDGKIVEIAETEQFFQAPKDPRTKLFVNGEMVY